ncbi:hypothetical protein SNE35_22700 [Paucibacter sp. R3-3]|uniref:AraC-type arabinose-binding/dimerisation domain-containing protein n=1 Tax=Roseateles agri TaxID=3098619 RepID=A0ABU5DNS6_9BURK|nr:hypothetical protein [Paucibacter sp. R3-3]MDY0747330.1 hypothetical protein [Paucibacter sp. R3-3]
MNWDQWIGTVAGEPIMWIKHLASFRGWRLELHKFVRADVPRCYHTHPAIAVRLILWGGYLEEVEASRFHWWFPPQFGLVRPELSHRIDMLANGRVSYSLWLRGPRTHEVSLRGPGWRNQLRAAKADLQEETPGGR